MATYTKLLNARDIVNDLAGTKLPPRLSLKLARSARKLFGALEDLEEVRKGLVAAYAKHEKNGTVKTDKKGSTVWEDEAGFRREMQEALDTESEVEFSPILLKHFPKRVEFTPMETLALEEAGLVKE